MIYKHPQFVLDEGKRQVFDENGKKLRITGNTYRVLVFLCEKKNATLTDIGTCLDWAKEYTENHIRQYRYKINNTIGSDVIKYENGVYSLRNTDLLQGDMVELEKSNKKVMEKENIKFTIVPAIIVSAMLFLAILNFPYGYYTLLRIVIAIISVYYVYWIYKERKEQGFWFWGAIAITILFNPVVPIHLTKSIWSVMDIIAGLFFISLIIKYKNKQKNI